MTTQLKLAGYTLIEILVVMVIISIVGATTLISINHNKNAQMEALAKQLVQTLTFAEEQAMLEPAILGFSLTSTTFQFYRSKETVINKRFPWEVLTDKRLGLHHLPPNLALTLKIQGKTIAVKTLAQPQLIISTNGDLTPFVILIGEKNGAPRYQVVGAENGSITSEKIGRLHAY